MISSIKSRNKNREKEETMNNNTNNTKKNDQILSLIVLRKQLQFILITENHLQLL